MRIGLIVLTFALAAPLAGCSNESSPMMMSSPMTPSTNVASMTGTWTGSASDSTGSMMGAGMSASMMSGMTWQITQTGNTFTGSMQFAGYGARSTMTVSGTITGKTATFTMTMPGGSMMTGSCTATANGTFDFDDLMTQMRGTYTGTNGCSGAFDRGQMSMTRR